MMTKKYRLKFEAGVLRDIERLPGHVRQRIKRTIYSLADNPRPPGAIELRNQPGRYRIRLDDWRILYRIDDEDLIVTLVKVGLKTGPEFYKE